MGFENYTAEQKEDFKDKLVSFGLSEGGSKTMFSQTSAPVKETVTQLSTVPVGFFFPRLTLSKCNSCLTPTCLVFKKCPRHWCQTSCQVIPHQGLLCHRTGSCEVSSIVGKHNHPDSRCSGLELFEMFMRPAWYTPVEALQPSHVSFWKVLFFLLISTQNTSSPANTFLFFLN